MLKTYIPYLSLNLIAALSEKYIELEIHQNFMKVQALNNHDTIKTTNLKYNEQTAYDFCKCEYSNLQEQYLAYLFAELLLMFSQG